MNLYPRPFGILMAVLVSFSTVWGCAQQVANQSENTCRSTAIVSVPSRPTVASATDLTQCGVLEAEYGFGRQWPGGGLHRDDLTGGFRFGLTPKIDLHLVSSDYLSLVDSAATRRGFGDTWAGIKYRLLVQGKVRPSLGVFYQAKIPSASESLGLGSGKVDHALAFLLSKDVWRIHFDFNVIPTFVGRPIGGVDHTVGLALATWIPVARKLTLVVEPYGYTAVNQNTPGFSCVMAGLSYQLKPRFGLDTGVDAGMMHGAPHKRVYVGMTYAVGSIYSWMVSER
jgi:hypothetical protein